MLEAFGRWELLQVIDVSGLVAEQRLRLSTSGVNALETPRERVYLPADSNLASRLKLSGQSAS